MTIHNFGRAKCTVVHHHQTVVLQQEYRKFPAFLQATCNMNPNTVTCALQFEEESNIFFRCFIAFPIAQELGRLTMNIIVADCFHFKTESCDFVIMNLATRTGFGRTILLAIAIIPIENVNHICWVLQMCLRHGMELKCAIFTDQGPMLAASAAFYKAFKIKLKLQLCLQHIIRCIR